MSLQLHDLPADAELMRFAPSGFWPMNKESAQSATERLSDKTGRVDLVNNGGVPFDYPAMPPWPASYPRFSGDPTQYLEAPGSSAAYGQAVGTATWVYSFMFNADFGTFTKPGGSPDWTMIAEHGSGGASGLDIELHIPTSGGPQIQVTYTDNTGALFKTTSGGIGGGNDLMHCVVVRTVAQIVIFLQGRKISQTTTPSRTTSGAGTVGTRIGGGGRTGALPFQGTIFKVAAYANAAPFLNADGTANERRVLALFEKTVPLAPTTEVYRSLNRSIPYQKASVRGFKLPAGKDATSFPLDATINLTSLRAALTTSFQQTVEPEYQDRGSSGVKCFHLIEGVHTPGVDFNWQRVRQAGGRGGNSKVDREAFWQALAQVPVPVAFASSGLMPQDDLHRGLGGSGEYDGNDRNTLITYQWADGHMSAWMLWHAMQNLGYSTLDNSQYTLSAGAGGSGSITAGVWRAALIFYNANGLGSAFGSPSPGVTLNGSQALIVSASGLNEDPADANPGNGDGWLGVAVALARTDVTGTAAQWFIAKRIAFGGSFPKPTVGTRPTTPSTPSGTITTGTLPAGSYTIQVAARNAYGSTLASSKAPTKTLSATGGIAWTWPSMPGATSYDVYGRNASGTLKLITNVSTNAWTDDGSLSVGTKLIPSKDNTANLSITVTLTDLTAAESPLGTNDAGVLAVGTGQTADVSIGTGGFINNVSTTPGWNNELGPTGLSHVDWESSASLVQHASVIAMHHEAARGRFGHPLGVKITRGNKITWRYPAWSTDSALGPIEQGMILGWARGTMAAFFRANPLTPAGKEWSPLFRGMFWAGENEGFCVIDSTAQGFLLVAEEDTVRGRPFMRVAYSPIVPPFGGAPSSDTDGGLHLLPWLDLLPVSEAYARSWIGV